MAGKKIIQLPFLGRAVQQTDLLEISDNGNGSYKVPATDIGLQVSDTPINVSDSDALALIKGDDGLWRDVNPLEYFNLMFQSGVKNTMPNIVDDNFDSFSISTDGNCTGLYGYSWVYTNVNGQIFGEPIRMIDYGNAYIKLWANQNSDYVEIDNVTLSGFTCDEYIYGNQFVISAPNLVSIVNFQLNYLFYKLDAPNLKYLGRLNVGNTNNVFDFPSLEVCGDLALYQQPALLNLPSLRISNSINCYNWQNTSFSLPSLEVCSNIQFSNCPGLIKIELPNLEYSNAIYIQNNQLLESIDLSSLRVCNTNYVTFQSNNLTQQAVDDILVAFANMDGQSSQYPFYFGYASLYLNGGTNEPPSQVGLNAISILQSRNVGVATN